MQVLKKHLGMHQPTIACSGFMYEEGEDLDEEEVQAHAVNLPKVLQSLPGNGSKSCKSLLPICLA